MISACNTAAHKFHAKCQLSIMHTNMLLLSQTIGVFVMYLKQLLVQTCNQKYLYSEMKVVYFFVFYNPLMENNYP
jgi:hypothetical protein